MNLILAGKDILRNKRFMEYKKIVKSQSLRFKILRLLSWVPDTWMVRIQYRIKQGRWPNMEHPTRYTEKLQLYKLKYRNPIMHQCVDKLEVRKYVEQKGLSNILNRLYGVYERAEDINFDSLPNRFVIKSTSGGGGNNVIVVKDKSKLDIPKVKVTISKWLNDSTGQINAGREWAYSGISETIIIIEEFLEEKGPDGNIRPLTDYKFFCFDGKPYYIYVVTDRNPGVSAAFGIYDMEFNKLPYYRADELRQTTIEPRPKNYDKMIEISKVLSEGFPHVRVDLYNINGIIYFGELTFYDGSGYFQFDPDVFDEKLGECFTEY